MTNRYQRRRRRFWAWVHDLVVTRLALASAHDGVPMGTLREALMLASAHRTRDAYGRVEGRGGTEGMLRGHL